ncbi:MAG TPA: DUF1569 domain-containing protein [Acidobacteriaceae bacterium]|jgi:hypothetical protein
MKTLSSADDLAAIRSRIPLIRPTDQPLWGSMSPHQMLCHLTDAFACPLGERDVAPFRSLPVPVFLFKWIALSLPLKWPAGIKTPPEIDQRLGGTPPTVFEDNRSALLKRLDQFTRKSEPWPPHPIFGVMTASDWMRWGYLHTDHHLRQFGR